MMCKLTKRICIGIIACLFGVSNLRAQRNLTEFQSPSMEYRPIPLWFWNNATIEAPKALEQFRQMIDKDGYGGCAILPFGQAFSPEYLSMDYLNLYGSIIEEARKKVPKCPFTMNMAFRAEAWGLSMVTVFPVL